MSDKKDNEVFSQDYKSIEQYILNGIIYKILVSGNQTQNKYSIIEITFPPGKSQKSFTQARKRSIGNARD